jgi:glucosamine-6-phosphate deaminase
MEKNVLETPELMGSVAGIRAAEEIIKVLDRQGYANIILATGTSQFHTLQALITYPGIDWSRITMFHLDEYIGIPITHPASFRKYLTERFITQVPALNAAHLIDGENDPHTECRRLGDLIRTVTIDVALVGIGENGHLAFNDPPADFETEEPYIVVDLDEACRQQQFGEGWFPSFDAVPKQAISMSIRQIMKSKQIICSVPDERKAVAVRDCLQKPISNQHPAGILREHPNCSLYLDRAAASLLETT